MKKEMPVFANFEDVMARTASPGALLLAGGADDVNVMTIGWLNLGIVWGRKVMVVYVRPSRHTYGFMKKKEFTVNIPTRGMKKEVAFCGVKSGRDIDKIAECGFTLEPAQKIGVPSITECPVHYECRTLARTFLAGDNVCPDVIADYYGEGDYHTVFYGEVLGAYHDGRALD